MTKLNLDYTPKINLVAEEPEGGGDIQLSRRFTGHSQRRNRNAGETHCCAFSPDGKIIAWSKGDGFVEVASFLPSVIVSTSSENGQHPHENWYQTIDCAKKVLVMEFNPATHDWNPDVVYILATGLESGRVKLWNPVTGDMLYNLSDHNSDVKGLSFSRSGEPLLISCSLDMTLKVWDLTDDGNMTLTITGHRLPVLDCTFSPTDPTLICSVGQGKYVFIWRLHHKRQFSKHTQLKGHLNDVVSCSWSPDGALVATASHDATVIIWDPHVGQQMMLLGHTNPLQEPIYAGGANGSWLNCVSFSPDGSRLATLCEDEKLRLWHLWSDAPTKFRQLTKPGTVCRFSPSGSYIALGNCDGSVDVMDVGTPVMSLGHLCRLVVRSSFNLTQLAAVPLPTPIKRYLQYKSSCA